MALYDPKEFPETETAPARSDAVKLDEARALIEAGWCRVRAFQVIDGRPHYCAIGAIEAVDSGSWRLRDYFLRANGIDSVMVWNDFQARDKAEVIEAFRKAAELARSEGAEA